MFKFLRPAMPAKADRFKMNPISYSDGSKQEFDYSGSEYWIIHTIPNAKSMSNPPPHIHLNQDECFYVKSGKGTWYMPRHPDPASREAVLDASAEDPECRKVIVPARQYHSFANLSMDTPLVVAVGLQERDALMEERFFRNFFAYIDDCAIAQSAPSIFQLMRFLWDFDCPLAVPVPGPNWFAVGMSRFVCFFAGFVVGDLLLGYKGSYPEYYNGKLATA